MRGFKPSAPNIRCWPNCDNLVIFVRKLPALRPGREKLPGEGKLSQSLFDLSGRVAIVTGGNGGIGLGMAEALAARGANVVIAARSAAKAEAALASLRMYGTDCVFVAVDVTAKASCDAMVAATLDRLGRVDILVSNAGIGTARRPETVTEPEWHQTIDVNLSGPFYCAQAVQPAMTKAGGGKIINVGSIFSLFGSGADVAYAASKGGIVQLTKSLAVSWARHNIQVNAVLPGWIDTDMTIPLRQNAAALSETILRRTPARRWGTPADLGGVAVFLASAASDFVTGTAITVDGGYSAQG
jgi:2-deoxy-D-gluconate 3-dehydrogenase